MEAEIRKAPIRFYEIDFLRFIAAISVVFYHYTYRGYAEGNYSPVAYPNLGRITKYGYLGVELFFIISGYVILLSAQNKTIRQFFISRVTRLYPVLWAACTLTFLVEFIWRYSGNSSQASPFLLANFKQYLLNMTMLNGFIGVMPIDGVYWSLSVEIRFYIIIALIIVSKQLARINFILLIWIIYAAIAGPKSNDFVAHLLLPRYAAYFASGMLFYLMQHSSGRTWFRYLLLAACYILSIRSGIERASDQSLLGNELLSMQIVLSTITLFFLVFSLMMFKKLDLSKFKWAPLLGALTYPLYLIHQHIGFILFNISFMKIDKYVALFLIALLMILFSYVLNFVVEKTYSKKLSKFMHTRTPGS